MASPKSIVIHAGVVVFVLATLLWSSPDALAAGWTIQVRSCLTQPEADGVVKNLQAYGLTPTVSYERAGNKGMRYRVLVGHFDGRNAAEIYAGELKSSGIIKSYWIKPAGGSAATVESQAGLAEVNLDDTYAVSVPESGEQAVYPPMPGQTPMMAGGAAQGAITYAPPPAGATVYGQAMPGAYVDPAPCAPNQAGIAGCQPAMPGSCTGTAITTPNQMMLEDQPPMNACNPYSGVYCPDCQAPDRRGLFLGYRVGFMVWPSADQFDIVQTVGGITTTWQADYSVVPRVSLIAGYRFNKFFAMEGTVDLPLTQNWSSWFLGFTPKFMYPLPGYGLAPYIKGGPVYGHFAWNNAPGSFDKTWGWEAGAGLDIELNDQMTLETGFGYRDISFTYNGTANTRAGHGDLDLRGYSLDVAFRYRF